MPPTTLYRGPDERTPAGAVDAWLSDPPPWRDHLDEHALERAVPVDADADRRGARYVVTGDDERTRVNLALALRRPLLVTGPPGVGKSSLAYGIAYALGLGAPLRWEINSQTTLRDGLYTYDAVGHFHAGRANPNVPASEFVALGPLGSALVPTDRPRVLLIDELDKASYDLPNDLLHVFEEGAFTIPELLREPSPARVLLADSTSVEDRVTLHHGRVRTRHHPVVVITSNAERDFSDAFKRRCVALPLQPLDGEVLERVVVAQLGDLAGTPLREAVERLGGEPTDVMLQVLFARDRLGFDLDILAPILRRRT